MVHARRLRRRDALAKRRLQGLLPGIGPWTSTALWHGCVPLAAPPDAPLDAEIDAICEQKLAGLLVRYVRESDASITTEQLARLQQVAFLRTAQSLAVASAGTRIVTDLLAAGTSCIVSKGPGVAAFYPSPECRPYSDIDVLVPRGRFASTVRELEARGWREEARNVQPWGYFRNLCREGLNLTLAGSMGSLDVHHRVPPWMWSRRLDHAAMAARAYPVQVGADTLRCLSPVDNLMVVALHLVSDRNAPGKSLMVWRDLVELVRVVPDDEVVAVASRCGLAGWLRAVLTSLPGDLRMEPLIHRLADEPISAALRLSLLLSPSAERFGVVATQFLRLPLLNGIAYVAGMLVPSSAFVRRKNPKSDHPYRAWWGHRGVHHDASLTSQDAA